MCASSFERATAIESHPRVRSSSATPSGWKTRRTRSREITGEETRLTGTIRITTPDVLGPSVVVPMLGEFHAKYPEIELEIDVDDRVRNLSKREADMAIRGGRPAERGVIVRKLAPLASTAYASRAYVEARGGTLRDASLPAMAQRILACAPPRFALAGVSMGGMIALELLAIAPERVTHLALVDTNARPDSLGRRTYRRVANFVVGMTRDFRRASERSVPSLVHPAAPDDVRTELVEMAVRVGPQAYIRQSRAVASRRDLRSVLPRVAARTAVVVGRDDRLTPVALSQEIHALISGSTLHVVPDCGHLPPIEKPQIMAALLRAFAWRGRARTRRRRRPTRGAAVSGAGRGRSRCVR